MGLVAALGVSWAGLVLGSNGQLGSLAPYYDENENGTVPQRLSGEAARGLLVYRDLGCASCHTQQVRRPDFGSDKAQGWGDRQSVARDYIYQAFPQLGTSRSGPDLANLSGRKPKAPTQDELYELLYKGHGGMPAYRFLFEKRKITGEISDSALNFSAKTGHEVVPSHRAEALVAYLLRGLTTSYDYPEARPVPAAKTEGAVRNELGKPSRSPHRPSRLQPDESLRRQA